MRRSAVIVLVAGGLALTGCGDDDTDPSAGTDATTTSTESTVNGGSTSTEPAVPADPDPEHEATEAGLQTAAQDAAERYLSDPATTWAYLSAACKARWGTQEAWTANVDRSLDLLEALTGVDVRNGSIGEVAVVKFAGTSGETYSELLDETGEPVFTQEETIENTESWNYEDGGWRQPECDTVPDPTEPPPE